MCLSFRASDHFVNKTTVVPVRVELDNDINSVPLLLEGNRALCRETSLIIERALLQPSDDGTACLKIYNAGGFTEWIEEGALLRDAEETCVVIPPEDHCDVPGEIKQIRMESTQENQGRRDRLMELIAVPNLLDPDKALLCEFLMDHNDVFALDETDRGGIDLIQRLIQERHHLSNSHFGGCHMLHKRKLSTNYTR